MQPKHNSLPVTLPRSHPPYSILHQTSPSSHLRKRDQIRRARTTRVHPTATTTAAASNKNVQRLSQRTSTTRTCTKLGRLIRGGAVAPPQRNRWLVAHVSWLLPRVPRAAERQQYAVRQLCTPRPRPGPPMPMPMPCALRRDPRAPESRSRSPTELQGPFSADATSNRPGAPSHQTWRPNERKERST